MLDVKYILTSTIVDESNGVCLGPGKPCCDVGQNCWATTNITTELQILKLFCCDGLYCNPEKSTNVFGEKSSLLNDQSGLGICGLKNMRLNSN